MTATLDTTVATFHGPLAEDNPAIWTGSLNDFWRDNTNTYPTYGDIRNVAEQLEFQGYVTVGGGAEAEFTIATKEYLERLALVQRSVPAMVCHDLGHDWYAVTYADGRMTIRNNDAGQRIELGAESVATLKRIFSDIENERLTPPVKDIDDDGCPKGDPECLGNNGDCHDACEAPSRPLKQATVDRVAAGVRRHLDGYDYAAMNEASAGKPHAKCPD